VKFPTAGTAQISNFYIGANDLWGGNAAIGNAATTIVLGNLDGTSKIALGPTADAITIAGVQTGFIADGGGNLRVGDANSWLKWSGGALSMQFASGESLVISAGGDIHLVGDNADPGKVYFDGTSYEVSVGCNAAGSVFQIGPDTDSVVSCQIGYGDIWTNRFSNVILRADTMVRCYAYEDATQAARIDVYSFNPRVEFVLEYDDAVNDIIMIHDSSSFRFYPDNNLVHFGLTGNRWKTGWFVDLTVTNCITEGTCEIIPGDALGIIRDIIQPGSGIFNEFNHERFDMKRLQPKYPYIFVYDEEVDEYREKIGTKSDLLYTAVMQLDQRVEDLEGAKPS